MMKTKKEQEGLTICKGHFTENLYDFLNTGSLDPIEINIPWRVYKTSSLYYWMVTYPTHGARSKGFKNYDACLTDFQSYCEDQDHTMIKK